MKRKLLIILGVLMLCTGCADSGTNEASTQSNKPFEIDAIEQDDKDEAQEGNSDTQGTEVEEGTKALNLPKFTGDYDVTCVPETDAQPSRNLAYTKDGYYRLQFQKDIEVDGGGQLLLFTDEATGSEVPVCSKNGCMHDGEECEAVFGWQEYPDYRAIYYYEGKLYVMKRDDGYVKIEQVALDGSYRKDSCDLLRVSAVTEETEDMIVQSIFCPEVTVHRGYAYFSTAYSGCEEAKLCRVPLDSDEKVEVLCEISGDSADLFRLKPYGKYVFFQMGYYGDGTITGLDFNIYCYDTEDGNVYQFADGIYRDFVVCEDGVYHFDMEQNIWKYDMATGESTLFYENDLGSCAEDYLYIQDYMYFYGDELVYEYATQVFDEVKKEEITIYHQVVLDKNGQIVKRLSSDKDKLLRLNDLW